jgi:hypothetical protein
VKARAEAAGAKMVEGPFLDFLDPGATASRSSSIPTSNSPGAACAARHGTEPDKNASAQKELAEKGMGPE